MYQSSSYSLKWKTIYSTFTCTWRRRRGQCGHLCEIILGQHLLWRCKNNAVVALCSTELPQCSDAGSGGTVLSNGEALP